MATDRMIPGGLPVKPFKNLTLEGIVLPFKNLTLAERG